MFADYSGKRKNYQKIKWILRERTSIFLLFILKNKKKLFINILMVVEGFLPFLPVMTV